MRVLNRGRQLVLGFAGRVLLLLSMVSGLAYAQSDSTSSHLLSQLLNSAYHATLTLNNDSAFALFSRAKDLSESLHRWKPFLYCCNGMAEVKLRQEEFYGALALLREAEAGARHNEADTKVERIRTLELLGFAYAKLDSNDTALQAARDGMALLETVTPLDTMRLGNFYEMIGEAFMHSGNYAEAGRWLHTAVRLDSSMRQSHPEEYAERCASLVSLLAASEEFDEALVVSRDAFQVLDQAHLLSSLAAVRSFMVLSSVKEIMGDLHGAVDDEKRALATALKIFGPNHSIVAECYIGLGEHYAALGDFSSASEHLEHSIRILESGFGPSHSRLAPVLSSLAGIELCLGNTAKALLLCDRAIAIRSRSLAHQHPSIAYDYETKARVFLKEGRTSMGLSACEKALSLRRLISSHDNRIDIIRLLILKGRIATGGKHYALARQALDEAFALHRSLATACILLEADLQSAAGDLALVMDKPDEALRAYQIGLIFLSDGFADSSLSANPDPGKIKVDEVAIPLLAQKSNALYRLYKQSHGNTNYLFASLGALQTALAVSERQRKAYVSEETRLTHGEDEAPLYERAIDLALEAGRCTRSASFRALAAGIADRSKARSLFDGMEQTATMQEAFVSDTSVGSLTAIDQRLTALSIILDRAASGRMKTSPDKIAQLESERFALRSQREQIFEEASRHGRADGLEPASDKSYDVGTLQSGLDSATGIIEYFVGKKSAYGFLITRDTIDVANLPPPEILEAETHTLIEALGSVDKPLYRNVASRLYAQLIKPLKVHLQGKTHLIMVLDGVLHAIPFETLTETPPSQTGEPAEDQSLRYLIRAFQIEYSYSLRTFSRKPVERGLPGETSRSFVGFAPVFRDKSPMLAAANEPESRWKAAYRSVMVDGKDFSELPYSSTEVDTIASLFRRSGIPASTFVDEQATEENFKRVAPRYSILHIATHGMIDQTHPELSALLFTQPNDSKAQEDGVLYAGETFNLRLNADLLVVSSCQSGVGKLIRGEGMIAMPRGFIHAGARRVVYSLWRVGDESTQKLMTAFYSALCKGKSYAESLQSAKLDLIRDPATAFPSKWAAFVLVGQ